MKFWGVIVGLGLVGCGAFLGAADDDEPSGTPVSAADASTDGVEGDTTISILDDGGNPSGDAAKGGDASVGSACEGKPACERYVFITSITYPGNFGEEQADGLCQERVDFNGAVPALKGRQFRAWITTNTAADVSARLGVKGTMAYKRVDGVVIAKDYTDLVDGTIASAIKIDETGATQNNAVVWTGTAANGMYISTNCDNWLSADVMGKVGEPDLQSMQASRWTESKDQGCKTPAHLYCFEY